MVIRWLAVFLLLLLASLGCDECEEGASHCDGPRRLFCVSPSQSSGAPSRAHWEEEDCGRADLCIDDQAVGAFCAIRPEVDAVCLDLVPPLAVACSGDDRLTCRAGYPIGRDRCLSCDDAGATCSGGYGAACASSDECAEGLTCSRSRDRPTAFCSMPCSCVDFAYCEDCRYTGAEEVSSAVAPMCVEGVCLPY